MDEFRHVLGMARRPGARLRPARPAQARELYPFLEPHDLEGVLWDLLDGDVDPSQLTQAYARLAREAGRRIDRFTRVTSPPRQLRRMAGRHRQGRDDPAEIVVNAAATGRARSWRCSAGTCRSSRCSTSTW